MKIGSQWLILDSQSDTGEMVEYFFFTVGEVGGEVLFIGWQDGVADVRILVFIAGGDEEREFLVEVDAQTDAGLSHRSRYRAMNHPVHLFGDGRDVPFETVPHIGIKHRYEFGFREIHGDVQVYGDEGGVLPKVKSGTQTQLEVRVELVS